MNGKKIAYRILGVGVGLLFLFHSNVWAKLTKEQSEDVATFAATFIEKGNERRDENGYPLLVYALSNQWKTCVEIRRSGYYEELYYVKNNQYHKRNGKYLDLGPKWCMDCGDYISYVYKTTLGLDLCWHDTEDPWHIKDMYADAQKGDESRYFEFVYQNVPISKIEEANLEKGDIVLRMGSKENHGLIYVGEGMQTAHASRNGIKYSAEPVILGFEVVQLNRFYKSSTIVSIVRVKDGVVSPEQVVNTRITWPDTGEEEVLFLNRQEIVAQETVLLLTSQVENEKLEKVCFETPEEIERMIIQVDKENYKITDLLGESNFFESEVYHWLIEELRKFLMGVKEPSSVKA